MKEKFNILNNNRQAILATNFYNLETLKAVLLAAKEKDSDIILQMTKSSIDYIGLENAVAMARSGLKYYGVNGYIHLDHGGSVELVEACINAGFDSVMYDGSELPIEENIENTKKVVKLAANNNINVEAELGYIAKLDQTTTNVYTTPGEAKMFVDATGVDTLAIAIGTAHGFYKEAPKLQFDILDNIKAAVNIPLVLHGGSGVPVADVQRAIRGGICKVNVATELKNMFMLTLKKQLLNSDEIDLRKVFPPATNAVMELVKGKLDMVNLIEV